MEGGEADGGLGDGCWWEGGEVEFVNLETEFGWEVCEWEFGSYFGHFVSSFDIGYLIQYCSFRYIGERLARRR